MAVVVCYMLPTSHHFKVLGAVVCRVPVLMMDYFLRFELPTQFLFRNDMMFENGVPTTTPE